MQILLYVIILTLTLLTAPFDTRAASDESPAKQDEAVKTVKGLPFRGKISVVDAKAQTLSLAGKKTRTFQITKTTKINKDGKPILLEDLAVGESVGGYALNDGVNLPQVVTLNIRTAEPSDEKGGDTGKP